MAELEVRPGEELERTLDRYARLRLEPSAAEARRARTAIMEAAWRRRIASPAAARSRSGWGPRRLGASLVAAVLAGLLVGSTAFAASRAGGPLYTARLGIEELTLPSESKARLEARLAIAQNRLAEVVDAVTRDDRNAVAAAITGYDAAIERLDDVSGAPADRALEAIAFHRTVLLDVLADAPDSARAGLENAIVNSGKAIERLNAAGPNPPATTGGPGTNNGQGPGTNNGQGPGTNNGQGTGGNNGQGPGGKPTKEPAPARTTPPESPEPTPKPTKPPKPGQQSNGQGSQP